MKRRAHRRRFAVCQACGKEADARGEFRDASCMTWGVDVWKDSAKYKNGRLVRAKACKKQRPIDL